MAGYIGGVPSETFRPGEMIFHQGDLSRSEAYLIDEGRVEVRRRNGEHERVLRTLMRGDLLGEVALFRDAPHSATAVALERVTLIVIPSDPSRDHSANPSGTGPCADSAARADGGFGGPHGRDGPVGSACSSLDPGESSKDERTHIRKFDASSHRHSRR
jgi:hypothetical protein